METVVGGGTLVRAAAAAGLLVATLVYATGAVAADLPGARLTVSRTAEAAACPDETTLAREMESRMTAHSDPVEPPLLLSVSLAADDDGFSATIRVEGRKQGTRTLKSKGPTCEGLREALMVSLLLLLDAHPLALEPLPPPKSRQETPVESPPTPAPPSTPPPPPTVWLVFGGAFTHGFPEGFWGAGYADLSLRAGAFDISVGGVLAPSHSHTLSSGRSIAVLSAGGRARACYALFERQVRIGACGFTLLSSLTGRGGASDVIADPNSRRWWLVGVGPDAYLPVSPRIGIGISAAVLAQTRGVSFNIQGDPGEPYKTDSVVGWLGVDFRVRIW